MTAEESAREQAPSEPATTGTVPSATEAAPPAVTGTVTDTAPPAGEDTVTTEAPPAAEPPGDSARDDDPAEDPDRRYGTPGRPLSRSPLMLGFAGGLGLLLAYSAYLAVQNILSILILIFIAAFLAIGLNPAVVRLQRWGLPRGLAVAGVGLGVVLLFGGAIYALVPPLLNQTDDLLANLPTYLDDLRGNGTLRQLNEEYQILDKLQSALTAENILNALGGVWGGAQAVFGVLIDVLTVTVLTIYFMAGFERLTDGAYRLVPASRRHRVRLLGDEILAKVGAYLAGALAIALIAGASTYIFLLVVGVAYPYALAVVVAITDLIPQVGATIGAIVVSIVGFATSVPVGIACVIFFLAYQQVENFLIYPKVMRRAVKVSDLAGILSVLIGVALLGVIGALIAIPVVAAVQLIVREVIIPRQQRR